MLDIFAGYAVGTAIVATISLVSAMAGAIVRSRKSSDPAAGSIVR
jgi:hypothetical protein